MVCDMCNNLAFAFLQQRQQQQRRPNRIHDLARVFIVVWSV